MKARQKKNGTAKRKEKNMAINLLPLGSLVLLDGGIQKLVIVGRGAVYSDPQTGVETYSDYIGIIYPTGLDPETTIFFNHDNIDKVVFEGFKDEEEDRFLEIYQDWESDLTIQKKEI